MIYLRDRNARVVDSWKRQFADAQGVDIALGDPLDVEGAAIVSPANSFGFMDGGIDSMYSRLFPGLEAEVRDCIQRYYCGEQPVGTSLSMAFGGLVWVIAPTMRTPQDVSKTLNAYLAFRAIIHERNQEIHYRGGPDSSGVSCPGLCTGYGRMSPEESARQMWHAYQRITKGFEVSSLAENSPLEDELRGITR